MTVDLQFDATYERDLHAAGLRTLDDFLSVRGGAPTSKHAHRETLPVQVPIDGAPRTFYLKRVFRVPANHALWPTLRGRSVFSQPAREWRICQDLARAGLPVMKAVAFGEERHLGVPKRAFLLVEAVPMPYTLEHWLVPGFPKPPPVGPETLRRLLYEVGVLIGTLYRAGFDWPDLSAKHIYAAPQDRRRWEFRLIDVERMTRSNRLTDSRDAGRTAATSPALASALSKLFKSLCPFPFCRFDYWRCWSGACRAAGLHARPRGRGPRLAPDSLERIGRGVPPPPMPRLPDDYEHPRSVPLRKVGKMFADERMIPLLQAAGIGGFNDVFHYSDGDALNKPGLSPHRERVRMEVGASGGRTRVFYLKRYLRPPMREQLRRIAEVGLKHGSGWREMHFIKRLTLLGIPTLRAVAFGQKMRGVIEKKSFAITEAIDGQSLERVAEAAARNPGAAPAWTQRREIIRQLAFITRRLHENRLYHRDLYLCHVFLANNTDGAVVLRLIDLARMIEKPRNPDRWRIKDLAALDYSAPASVVTRADRVRFLYDYDANLAGRPAGRAALRALARSVRSRARRMARHDAKRKDR
ncbi:MAG: lipopolysaccharide kinase InaA family protein [Phycisphaerae bacterium]